MSIEMKSRPPPPVMQGRPAIGGPVRDYYSVRARVASVVVMVLV